MGLIGISLNCEVIMDKKKEKTSKKKEDNLTPAFKALLGQLDDEEWQIVTFEVEEDEDVWKF